MKLKQTWFIWFLLLTACASFQPKTPQDAINEANVIITSVAQQVTANVKAGIMTTQERDSIVADLKKYAIQVDNAQAMLRAGNPQDAQQQVALINSALMSLNKRLAEKARK